MNMNRKKKGTKTNQRLGPDIKRSYNDAKTNQRLGPDYTRAFSITINESRLIEVDLKQFR